MIDDESRFKGKAIYEHCLKNGGEDYIRRQIARAEEEGLETKDGRKVVQLGPDRTPQNVKEVELAIKASSKCQIFRRGRFLVEPLWEELHENNKVYLSTWLRQLNITQLGNLVQKHAVQFQIWNNKAEAFAPVNWTSAQAVLETLLGLEHQDLQTIRGVIMSPTMRPDGTLITVEGYDEATQLWHRKSPDLDLPSIPDKPTRKEALAALKLFDGLLTECAFADDISKAVALAAMLTVAVRAAFPNAPHFNYTAPRPRSGKSYLCETTTMIGTGLPIAPTAGSANKEEMEKRIETALFNGRQILFLNNVPDGLHLTSPALETIASEGQAEIRMLGKMAQGFCDCRGVTTVFINGNNIVLTGALVERTLNCRLDTKMENPGQRTYKGKPKEMIRAERGKYLAAAFIIVRAYIAAGSPITEAIPFAGFDDWSRMVRQPLLWLGVLDPVLTIESARALDPERQELRALVLALRYSIGVKFPFETATLISMATEGTELHRELVDSRGKIEKGFIGRKLSKLHDQISDGFRIERVKAADKKSGSSYQLVWMGEGEPPEPPPLDDPDAGQNKVLLMFIDNETAPKDGHQGAIMVSLTKTSKQVWLPLSKVEVGETTDDGRCEVTMPKWLARGKGLAEAESASPEAVAKSKRASDRDEKF